MQAILLGVSAAPALQVFSPCTSMIHLILYLPFLFYSYLILKNLKIIAVKGVWKPMFKEYGTRLHTFTQISLTPDVVHTLTAG
jgi:hypothetical protein